MKVLIVDDDKSTLVMLRLQLARAGFRVSVAPGADEALQTLGEARYDWLVVDGQLGETNGFELAARAKALQPDLKTVMISGVYGPEDVRAPIARLFQKPIEVDALASYLRGSTPG